MFILLVMHYTITAIIYKTQIFVFSHENRNAILGIY